MKEKIADAMPSKVLIDSEVIKKSNLRETSLYTFSKMAVSQGSFCDQYELSYGPQWTVEFSKE